MTAQRQLIEGQKFNRLSFVREIEPRKGGRRYAIFVCECGRQVERMIAKVTTGEVKGCGCRRGNHTLKTHGESVHSGAHTAEYVAWTTMKSRCNNPKNASYGRYGGRGIRVCQRWSESYQAFLSDMGRKPSPTHTMDRIDPDGDYQPTNCRWASKREQVENRKITKQVTYHGETMPLARACDLADVPYDRALQRIRRGYSGDIVFDPSSWREAS